jgi:endoglycosylceramidase
MPDPGRIDTDYLDSIERTVDILTRHRLFVLLDFHQDGYGPATHGNGMPEWATLTDGLPNPPAQFPLYYVQNPSIQRAFDNFWANRAGPDGVPLQEHYATGMRTVAERFSTDRYVLGYEPMNEPWPGTDWTACLTGCPELEAQLLEPFYERMEEAVRSVDAIHPIYEEPFVLFNFGRSDTSLPGPNAARPRPVLSTHVYALTAAEDALTMDRSVAAAERDGVAVLVTEWGAVNDPTTIDRLADQFDERLLPWLFWAYNEHVVHDSTLPLTGGNVNTAVLGALARPFPSAVNGTPVRFEFDASSGTVAFDYSTTRPDGRRAPRGSTTSLVVPDRTYPGGYRVEVDGADVVSEPCAPVVQLRHRPRAGDVSVRITPGSC